MKLRQLFENVYEQNGDDFDGSLKTIGVSFGRFNPPHKGHKEVWKAAAKNPIWYIGTNQNTTGPKDPLPYDVKLQAMAAVWPGVQGHVIPEQSLLTLAARIYEKHGSNVHLKVYTDEDWLVKTLMQYNGVEKEHGMYKFQQIDQVKTQRLASATNLRAAVRSGDRKAFYHDMGVKPSVTVEVEGRAYPLFDVVAHYLNQYPEKTKKAVAEGFDAAEFSRHMEKLRAREELRKTDPMRALVGDMIDKDNAARKPAKKQDDDSMSINDPRHPGWSYTEIGHHHNVDEGDVVQFPKKHKGDITNMHSCPKCGGDLQGGKYMGHQVQVCMPCKQVYLPPNSGIDQKGNKIQDEGFQPVVPVKSRSQGSVSPERQKDIDRDVKLLNKYREKGMSAGSAADRLTKFKHKHMDEIAGAFPSPSTRAKWAADAAASNAAEAKRQAALQAQADAERLRINNAEVEKQQRINYHAMPDNEIPAKEGLGDVVKGVKRKIAGKEDPEAVVQRRYMDYVSKRMTGDPHHKAGKRYDKVDQVVRKRELDEVAMRMQGSSQSEKDATAREKARQAEEIAKHQAIVQAYVKIMAAGQPLPPKMQQSYNTMPEFKKEVDAALASIPGQPGVVDLEQRKNYHLMPKNEDAAGVGIITKQNSTADVNAGTPRKNLDAFNLEESNMSELHAEIQDHLEKKLAMFKAGRVDADALGEYCVKLSTLLAKKHNLGLHWIQDAINDYVDDELGGSHQLHEARGHMKQIDKEHKAAMQNAMTIPSMNQSTGSAYLGWRMGIALAGAPDYPTKMAADNWIGGDPLLSTYTQEEYDMVKKAAAQVGGGKIQNWSGKRSQEIADVNKTSTVAKIKKNKYGV